MWGIAFLVSAALSTWLKFEGHERIVWSVLFEDCHFELLFIHLWVILQARNKCMVDKRTPQKKREKFLEIKQKSLLSLVLSK